MMINVLTKIISFLIVVAYAPQAVAFIFGPADYEECSSNAAKEAKNRDALLVMLRNCDTKFPARKNEYGQYVFYDRETNTNFIVSSPKLSDADRQRIRSEKAAIRQRQLKEAQARAQRNAAALPLVEVTNRQNQCYYQFFCDRKILTVTLKNNYHTAVNKVSVGWVIAKNLKECGAIPTKATRDIVINPGQSAVLTFETSEGPNDSFMSCIGVTAVNVR